MRSEHLNFGALKALGDEKTVKGIPHINHPNQLCETCLLGKHVRRSFPKEVESRVNGLLQLVHTVVCSPIDPPSFGKNKYFLLFIDNFSMKTWYKYEAFVIFKNFKALVENESSYNEIRCLLTVPRTLQQNWIAERKNRTILNMARCMLKVKSMPKAFCVEAVSCTIYLSNLSPTRNVKGQTPQEAWSGVKPKVDHFRVFRSIAYAHVPNQRRSKLDDRSVKHVFIGYDANSKGYKLYNPNNGKMIEKVEDTYDFLPYFEEGDQEVIVPNKFSTLPLSPTPSIHELSSSKGVQDKRWRQAMEEEIKAIKKNDT
ncbi:hypothetical protein CR513_33778, partial [Mucuna pruriens]